MCDVTTTLLKRVAFQGRPWRLTAWLFQLDVE